MLVKGAPDIFVLLCVAGFEKSNPGAVYYAKIFYVSKVNILYLG